MVRALVHAARILKPDRRLLAGSVGMTDTFPRQQARTQGFSLGAPRSFQVSPDGTRVAFLRSKSGTDPVTCLWVLDLPAGTERLVADPSVIGGEAEEPEEEKARRERSRELAGGVVAFATNAEFTVAAFALAGRVYTASLTPDGFLPRRANAMSPAIDPRPDPSGQRVAYVCDGTLRVTDPATGVDGALIGPRQAGADEDDVTFGLAEFVAAEEMDRHRGYWWAPDGTAILVARVDNSRVRRFHIADPANPGQRPAEIRYPAAGTANAAVSLLVAGLDGSIVPVAWDTDAYPYLAAADWDAVGPLIAVQSRDQRLMRLLAVDAESGQTSLLRQDIDRHWVDIVAGVPARTADGRVVWTTIADGTTRLLVADPADLADGSAAPVTPAGMQVRAILSVDGDTVMFAASQGEPTEIGVWAYRSGELARVSVDGPDGRGGPDRPGVDEAVRAGGTTVLTVRSIAETGAATYVLRPAAVGAAEVVTTIGSMAERPIIGVPRVTLLHAGRRKLRTALVLPSWYAPGSAALPVLMDPYAGPHSQRVIASADAYLTPQWLADQGFAVVVADGRGTPGRGSDWERAIAGDLASPALEDQVDALAAVAEHCQRERLADLDLTRVGIRGWSFGGFVSALAVLRRPDVFHAAIAGAPPTDWRLYDTHYTERYLGHPDEYPGSYDRSSLIDDAPRLTRPLMIIHGLADDNVVVAHTLRLSSALLAAGRPHCVLPLTGVTHLASQEEVAENLLILQVDFLRSALAVEAQGTHSVQRHMG
jgi:dipeptidyl-peptidase 4